MSEEKINKDRKVTPADEIIWDWLQSGQSISNPEAITRFGNACLRDAIWRLSLNRMWIPRKWIYYEKMVNGKMKTKKFKLYFITEPTILPAGYRTQKQVEKAMGEKGSLPEIS
ncbi:MAG TPA: hypothetical protein PK431_10690, partial [Chitinophagales bacterium]|nr:hypothetical protein [Chitinophagales bacterium]